MAAGDLNGDKKLKIVSTSAEGKVHAFDADGKSLATFDPPFYSDGVRVGRLSKSDTADTIVATSSDSIAALNGKGKVLWSHSLPAGINHLDSMAICPTRPWVVCGCRGGKVVVVDCAAEGKPIADATGAKMFVDATWAIGEDHETPLVLVSDGRALSAFRVKPKAATGKEKDKEKPASAAP